MGKSESGNKGPRTLIKSGETDNVQPNETLPTSSITQMIPDQNKLSVSIGNQRTVMNGVMVECNQPTTIRRKGGTDECNQPAETRSSEDITATLCDMIPRQTDRTSHHAGMKAWPPKLKALMRKIDRALQWKPQFPFDDPIFKFQMTLEAAAKNLEILRENDYDLQRIITGPSAVNTPIRPGSEIRPVDVLEQICKHHPLWWRIRRMLTEGFTMPLDKLPETERVQDTYEAIRYGNHKSTQRNPSVVLEMLRDEVERGWQLVLPCASIPMIPGTIVSPLGLVNQNTINERGETTTKWRLTHDQSFKFQSGTSVNSRVQKERLAKCMYGMALRRFLHSIVHYRSRFPTTPILMAKFDLKSAYRRAHFSGHSAVQSIATSAGLHQQSDDDKSDKLAFISLRFTFGGSSNPSEFSTISEVIADLANTIAQHKDWDPMKLRSDFISLTGEKPKLVEERIEFEQARPLIREWELSEFGATEAYIDDIFTVFPFVSMDHFQRGRNAALLAIDTFGRPCHEGDPLPRDPIVATKKVMAEGTPSEILTVLGWEIDTRRLLIKLPEEKAASWDSDLDELIRHGDEGRRIGVKRLETIQGRNIHVATIVPGAMHFQSRMYSAINRAKKHKFTRLRSEERKDLRLLQSLLTTARVGISLNSVVPRLPDHIGRSDAFEGGIGGYDLKSGQAWRFEIPPDLRHRKSQNFLEYLACMTQLVCMLTEGDWRPGDCFLSVGDNTSALGWIHKSNFQPDRDLEQATHLALARYITNLLAELRVVQFGQWLPGIDNGVADALSRQHEKSDEELTRLIVASYPSQTPLGFRIRALRPEITSWVRYWVLHTHETRELPPGLSIRETRHGKDGLISCTSVNSKTTCSLPNSLSTSGTCSSVHSHRESEITSGQSPQRAMITWLQEHAAPPSTLCVRPSSQPVSMIPARTRMENLRTFYNDNCADTRTMTQPSSPKKRSHSACSRN
jgi:hypothetical protein